MGLSSKKPKPPKEAPKPPAPVMMEDPQVQAAKQAEIMRLQKQRGRRSTILAGASENVAARRTTLGGQ